jgi:hypothetical protein
MALKDGTLLSVQDKESKRDWKLLSRRFEPRIVDVEIKELISRVTAPKLLTTGTCNFKQRKQEAWLGR